MNAEIKKLIDEYGNEDDFTKVSPSPETIETVQKNLGVVLPQQFLDYLAEYSHGGIAGVKILGIGLTGTVLFERTTLDYREYGLPANLVIVENADEWVYCLDCDTGHVVSWDPSGYLKDEYPCFDDFLLDEFTEAADNL